MLSETSASIKFANGAFFILILEQNQVRNSRLGSPSRCSFVPQISLIYTDLDLFGLWDDADLYSLDFAELSDEKSAESA